MEINEDLRQEILKELADKIDWLEETPQTLDNLFHLANSKEKGFEVERRFWEILNKKLREED